MRTLEQLLAPDADLTTLTPEEEKLLFADEPEPTPTPEPEPEPTPTPTEDPTPTPEPEPTPTPGDEPKKKLSELPPEEIARKAWEAQNEANRYKQLYEDRERKLKEAQEKVAKSDVWDADTIKQTMLSVEELRIQNEQMAAKLAERERQEQMAKIYAETENNLELLAGKPSKPIAELNDLFLQTFSRLQREPTTAELSEAIGNPDDATKFMAAYHTDKLMRQAGISFKAAWVELGFDERFEKPGAKAPATSTPAVDPASAAHLERAAKVTPTLGGHYGASGAQDGITAESAEKWLSAHPDPLKWNDEDRNYFAKIEQYFKI